jgi:hypothetical protein
MLKAAATVVVVLAVVVGGIGFFTDCESQGHRMELAAGMTAPMKCHWTGVAETALAVPLVGVGGLLGFSRRKETRRALSALGVLIGAYIVMVPTMLIGVCPGNDMLCNQVMRPTLVLAGILVAGISLVSLLMSWRAQPDEELR